MCEVAVPADADAYGLMLTPTYGVSNPSLLGWVGQVAGSGLDERRNVMVTTNPRIPADEREVFAMAWMIGYLGWAPDELVHAFPDVQEWSVVPTFIPDLLVHEWKRGYDSGVAFFSDHALDEEA